MAPATPSVGAALRRLGRCLPPALITLLLPASARATTYEVGSGKAHATVASLPKLSPGDVVEISPGTYNEVKRWTDSGAAGSPITIRGVGTTRPIFDATGKTVDGVLPNPRAVFQIEGGHVIVENLEFRNARNGDNGAGIRVAGDEANDVVVRNCKIHDCDMGLMNVSDNLLIDACEISGNGTPLYDGYSHNLYLGGGKVTLQYSYIHDSQNGQNVKSRAHYTELLYNYIVDSQDGEVGLVDAAETETPNSNAVMIGNVVVSKPRKSGYNSSRFVWFGQDGGGAHAGTLHVLNNTFVAGDSRITFLGADAAAGASLLATNNIFGGSDGIAGAGPISGSNNCVPKSASVPPAFTATVKADPPGFVDGAGRNYHLMASSPCRDTGATAPSYKDGSGATQSGVPLFEYVRDLMHVARPSDGKIDIGAYEYGTATPPDGAAGDGGGAGGGTGGAGGGVGGETGGAGGGGGGGTGGAGGGGGNGGAGGNRDASSDAPGARGAPGCSCRTVGGRGDDAPIALALLPLPFVFAARVRRRAGRPARCHPREKGDETVDVWSSKALPCLLAALVLGAGACADPSSAPDGGAGGTDSAANDGPPRQDGGGGGAAGGGAADAAGGKDGGGGDAAGGGGGGSGVDAADGGKDAAAGDGGSGADAAGGAGGSKGRSFGERCADPSVIACFGFDTPAEAAKVLVDSGDSPPEFDGTWAADGAGSIHMRVLPGSGADTSGHASLDIPDVVGEGGSIYVQWRQRFSASFLAPELGGWKQVLLHENTSTAGCSDSEVVVVSYYDAGFPSIYHACGIFQGLVENPVGGDPYEFNLQPGGDNRCLYSWLKTGIDYVEPTDDLAEMACVGYEPEQWMTFQIGVHLGKWCMAKDYADCPRDSRIELWITKEGMPPVHVFDWPLALRATTDPKTTRWGDVMLTPYATGKDPAKKHAPAELWYDSVVVSRSRVAEPG